MLKSGGLLVVGDVIPPQVRGGCGCRGAAAIRPGTTAFSLLPSWGLLRTRLSSYWRLRSQLGLTRYAKAAMLEKLDAAGFDARLAPSNIGHNQARQTYYAVPR